MKQIIPPKISLKLMNFALKESIINKVLIVLIFQAICSNYTNNKKTNRPALQLLHSDNN